LVLTLTETSGSLTLDFASPKRFGAGTCITLAAAAAPTLSPPNALAWLSSNFTQTPASAATLVTLQP
jgi:hypothetical protein